MSFAQGGTAVQNWRTKVGAAVAAPDTIKTVMASVPAEEQLAFVQELITAAAAVPGDGNARLAVIKAVSINGIAAVGTTNKIAVIAEIIATTPIAYLPHLCSELATRFSPQINNLSSSQFQSVGEQVVQKVADRVAGSEDVNIRTACAISCFLTTTTSANDPIIQSLMAKVPAGDAIKPEVIQSLAVSVASGNAAPVYAAANVPPVVTTPLTTTGSSGTEQGGQQGATSEGGITLNTPLTSYLSVSGHTSQGGLLTDFGSSSESGSGMVASGGTTGTAGTGGSGTSGGSTSPEGIQVVPQPSEPTCSDTNSSP